MTPSLILRNAIGSNYNSAANHTWQELSLKESIDWDKLTNEAQLMGLGPLLYDTLIRSTSTEIPPPLLEKLRQTYYDTASLNLLALGELSKVIKTLAIYEIPTIILKGAALVQLYYPNIALRPMVDIDLLIPFTHLPETLNALSSLDFEIQEPYPFQDKSGLCRNEILFNKPGLSNTALEVHWNLIDNPFYAQKLSPNTYLFPRSIQVQLETMKAQILAPIDQIIHLCIHDYYHHQSQVNRTGVDLAFLLNHYCDEIDWDHLTQLSVENKLTLAIKTTLSQAKEIWFAPIPEKVLEDLANHKSTSREKFFYFSQRSEFLKLLRTFVTLPGFLLRVRFLFGQLLPDRDYMVWRYGIPPSTPLIFAYGKRYASGFSGLIREIKMWLWKK